MSRSSKDKEIYEPLRDSLEFEAEKAAQFQPTSYERPYRRLRVINAFLIAALTLTVSYLAYVKLRPHQNQQEGNLLGSDPFGLIPPEVGEPRRWMTFDKSDPYYIPYDIFDDLERVDKIVDHLADLDHPAILTNGRKTHFMHVDGTIHELPSTTAYRNNMTEHFPVYFTRGFHQMHCITLFTHTYGHIIHGKESQFGPEHVAHCLNVLREAVSCLADSSVASFTYKEDWHIAQDQQYYCRDYMAVRKWADSPENAARYDIVENLIPDNLKLHQAMKAAAAHRD
ncbi:uncharacterized protein PpBr36_10614 [Pyricularia pennisetigena]|uniref:uncharacterized protein n=1 Tax=Pyricularia pennisetigena TaxID=1578925 RepID=UPI001152BA7F|nr:uncharacterized protein PpBr36_10614 [Pyricularia pennisetigena]TLS21207.1 hypothetical protein PpBr36_10614 [Pyricularia pennisetigena]